MAQDIFLWAMLVIYTHISRYGETRIFDDVKSFKDYMNFRGGVFYWIIATQLLILIGYEFLKMTAHGN